MTRIDYDELMRGSGYSNPRVNDVPYTSFKAADEHFNRCSTATFTVEGANGRIVLKSKEVRDVVEHMLAARMAWLDVENNTVAVRGKLVHWQYDGIGYVVTINHGPSKTSEERYARPAQVAARIFEIDLQHDPRYC